MNDLDLKSVSPAAALPAARIACQKTPCLWWLYRDIISYSFHNETERNRMRTHQAKEETGKWSKKTKK